MNIAARWLSGSSFAAGSFEDRRRCATRARYGCGALAFFGPVLGSTAAGTWLAAQATAGLGGPMRIVLLALVAVNLFYMALTGWPAVLGFILHLRRRKVRVAAAHHPGRAAPPCSCRSTTRIRGRCSPPSRRWRAQIAEAGLQRVDLFVLSDTQDPAIAAAERPAFDRAACAHAGDGPRLRYRRRGRQRGPQGRQSARFLPTAGATRTTTWSCWTPTA